MLMVLEAPFLYTLPNPRVYLENLQTHHILPSSHLGTAVVLPSRSESWVLAGLGLPRTSCSYKRVEMNLSVSLTPEWTFKDLAILQCS